ncbi:hypothetical protein B0H67DRAFT_551429 [Lasiosphaeris hirsuta]|uniref:Uncharacterized protein n=1 Tax=Lasiosphaeris hirsuta TaxID=260670 RepID=A0AA40E6N5_9PEZI|nr:hypothetical protein B0H67DRAFT_551429 [Lasiosphaeris hirsuta]
MASQALLLLLTSLSLLGLHAVWGVMYLNGALHLLLTTALSGTYPHPHPRPLVSTYTTLPLLDFPLRILVIFFDSLLSGPDPAPSLILLELVATLLVINTAVLTESRRPGAAPALRRPALWQYAWNCAGVAVFLPLWVLAYTTQPPAVKAAAIPRREARAVPLTAAWSVLLAAPLLAPAAWGAGAADVQWGVVVFFGTPVLFVAFQRVISGLLDGEGRGQRPVRVAYWLVGVVSAAVHVGTVCWVAVGGGGGAGGWRGCIGRPRALCRLGGS